MTQMDTDEISKETKKSLGSLNGKALKRAFPEIGPARKTGKSKNRSRLYAHHGISYVWINGDSVILSTVGPNFEIDFFCHCHTRYYHRWIFFCIMLRWWRAMNLLVTALCIVIVCSIIFLSRVLIKWKVPIDDLQVEFSDTQFRLQVFRLQVFRLQSPSPISISISVSSLHFRF